MQQQQLKNLLNQLPHRLNEPVRPGLAEDIKHQIPPRLSHHRAGMDTINIVINLRVNKLTAAATIIVTTILLANFLGTTNTLLYERFSKSEMLTHMDKLHQRLLDQGKEVTYYPDSIDLKDRNAVLMHWKLPSGKYKVVFSDLRMMTVSSDILILLQAQMLRHKALKK